MRFTMAQIQYQVAHYKQADKNLANVLAYQKKTLSLAVPVGTE